MQRYEKKFNYYIGIDVSKLTLDVTVLYESAHEVKTDYYRIENSEKSMAQFVKKNLCKYASDQMLFCMENTDIYSLQVAYYMSDNDLTYWQVASVEIKRSKGIARGKSDRIDSKDIAFYAYTHLHKFRPGVMPARSIQQLRLLFTDREKTLKALALFGTTAENKDFVSKEVFHAVAFTNRSIIRQLKQTLKQIEKKMPVLIASEEKLDWQYKLIVSIPGAGM